MVQEALNVLYVLLFPFVLLCYITFFKVFRALDDDEIIAAAPVFLRADFPFSYPAANRPRMLVHRVGVPLDGEIIKSEFCHGLSPLSRPSIYTRGL